MRIPVLLYTNNKGADQPAQPRSLISTFVVRCLDSIIPVVSISETSSLCLASVAVQVGLCLTWSQTPKTGFLVTRLICLLTSIVSASHFLYPSIKLIEPRHDKTKMAVQPAKTQISLGIRPV